MNQICAHYTTCVHLFIDSWTNISFLSQKSYCWFLMSAAFPFSLCMSLGVTHELASTLDILPTITSLAGAKLPQVVLDGVDMTEILVHQGKVVTSHFTLSRYWNIVKTKMMYSFLSVILVLQSKRETMIFYPTDPSEMYGLFALRLGKYKAHFYTRGTAGFCWNTEMNHNHTSELRWFWFLVVHVFASGATHSGTTPDQDCPVFAVLKAHDPPLLFQLEADPSERYPLPLMGRPDLQALVERVKKVKEQFEASMVFGESQISKGIDPGLEPCCNPQCSPKPKCCQCWSDTFSQLLMKTIWGRLEAAFTLKLLSKRTRSNADFVKCRYLLVHSYALTIVHTEK